MAKSCHGHAFVDHIVVFATLSAPPLLRVEGGNLDSWSSNYHVIEITSQMIPSSADVLVPNDLVIELGTSAWSHDLEPPFHHVLLINADGTLRQAYSAADGQSVSRTIPAATLGRMGVGGRVVIGMGTRQASGSYYLKVRR